jgi:hypothetical protein
MRCRLFKFGKLGKIHHLQHWGFSENLEDTQVFIAIEAWVSERLSTLTFLFIFILKVRADL